MKKTKEEKKETKELISLNSKIIDVVKIDELEERLELAAPWLCNNCDDMCPCYTTDLLCNPTNSPYVTK